MRCYCCKLRHCARRGKGDFGLADAPPGAAGGSGWSVQSDVVIDKSCQVTTAFFLNQLFGRPTVIACQGMQ